jgi:hypothetical protein
MAGSNSVSSDAPDTPPLTVIGIKEMGQDKLQKLQKVKLLEVVQTCMAHITLLESEKHKAPTADSDVLRTELRELKEAVFFDSTGANAHGVVPVGLTQGYWDTGDRSDIRWGAIHKLAAEQNGTPVASNADATPAASNADVTPGTSVGEDDTTKSVKLAKRVKLAKSTALWCLSPFTSVTQEAMDKTRMVCPVNHVLAVAHAYPICGKRHREEERPQASPSNKGNNGGKGSNGSNARRAEPKPDKYLNKLEAVYRAEELKAKIRAQKMMSQGILFSQVAQAQVPAKVAPAPAQAPALAPAPLHGPGGRGHPVDRHDRDHGRVVRGGVGEHAHRGLQVLGHADVVEDRPVPPHFSVLPLVLAV